MVALLVEVGIVGALDPSVALGRDDDLAAAVGDPVCEMVGIVSLVGDGRLRIEAVHEVVGERDVIALARRADQADREAERLGGGVDLGAQPAARPAQALGIRPPLTLRAPAAC